MDRPVRSLHRVTVERAEHVTPRMKRVVIDGGCLSDYRTNLPAQWLKVFVPARDGEGAPRGRAYTARRFDPATRRLELNFVLHDNAGPASAWAALARPGDTFEISGTHPRSGLPVQDAVGRYLFFGDQTALPAIGAILEALPAHARADAFVEVDAGEEQTIETVCWAKLHWLHHPSVEPAGSGALEAAAKSLGRPDENTVVWIAAESAVARSLREHALKTWSVDGSHLHAVGYWKRG